jgi:hypothetical protein
VRWTYDAPAALAPPTTGPERRVIALLSAADANGSGEQVNLEESTGRVISGEGPFTGVPLTEHAPLVLGTTVLVTTKLVGKVVSLGLNGQTEATGAHGYGTTAPLAAAPDGTARIASTAGSVAAVRPADAGENWSHAVTGAITSAPAIGPDGTTYVATDTGHLLSIGPTGAAGFDLALHGFASGPSVLASGAIAVGEIDGLRVVSGAGQPLAAHARKARVVGTKPRAAGGFLAWGEDGLLESLDDDGAVGFSFATDAASPIYVPPVELTDGKIALIDSAGIAYLVNSKGVAEAKLSLGSEPLHEIAVGPETGSVFVALGSKLEALDFELQL